MTYEFKCPKCELEFKEQYSIKKFSELVDKNLTITYCPSCETPIDKENVLLNSNEINAINDPNRKYQNKFKGPRPIVGGKIL